MKRLKMKKIQYDINRETQKISALSSAKISKYEYLTGEKILPPEWYHLISKNKYFTILLQKELEKLYNSFKT